MHSCETVPAPPPATGPNLLQQLGRLIIRARSSSPSSRVPGDPRDRLLHAKLLAAKPSTSQQVQSQPKLDLDEPKPQLEAQLSNHVHSLWSEQIPICIEVLLAPDCQECVAALNREEKDSSFDKLHSQQRALLLERWTMRAIVNRPHDSPAFMTSQWLLNAVRSQLHFSQLAAWLARLKNTKEDPTERRRKLSRETCNFKKVEANCDEKDLPDDQRKLNVVYSIKIPGESYKMAEFSRTPTDHTFPVTDIGNNLYLKVMLESLPRTDVIPKVKCTCQPKRRASKEFPANVYDELAGKLNDLSLGPKCSKYQDVLINSNVGNSSRRLSIVSNEDSTEYLYTSKEDKTLVDDRMHTPCKENGKHKCSCDDESDNNNRRSSTSISQEPKKIDERRLKEIAKYKRRLRKEKLKKLCESTSSEGEKDKPKEFHTSIPILQAARFDRFRAIGCYRNQTYLTLPASRIESRSPFTDAISVPVSQFKRTNTVSTQTDDFSCQCGTPLQVECERCSMKGMVRSEANYNLASLNDRALEDQQEVGIRRKRVDDVQALKKHKCDNPSSSSKCDINFSFNFSDSELGTKDQSMKTRDESIIKRPKLRRFFPIVDKIERIVTDRFYQKDQSEKDIEELHLKNDDSVFSRPKNDIFSTPLRTELSLFYGTNNDVNLNADSKNDDAAFSNSKTDAALLKMEKDDTVFSRPKETKRQKTFSINDDDYVMYEKCDYGSFDKCDAESPREEIGCPFPDSLKPGADYQIPSPTEMDKFRWRFDSAASMVFHSKTGLPLTSSPAPLRRGNTCFDFDDSINGIPGIKSALFHPISPPSPSVPPSPQPLASPAPPPAPIVTQAVQPLAKREKTPKLRIGPSAGLLGSFEESALKGRLEPVATVHGFTAELGASGAFCPPHKRLPVTVFFYAPGETNAPYMGHINLGSGGYRVPISGTIQVSLFNPHGTLVKMFVVLYDLTSMPPNARTFLRQRTLYMPAGTDPPSPQKIHKWLRYLIHLRFMTSKSGKLYLHTDIRIIVSRKADLDTATAHSAIFKPIPTNQKKSEEKTTNKKENSKVSNATTNGALTRRPNRVFGGCSEFDSEIYKGDMREIGYDNQNSVSYELRSFTYAPENPKYSPR